ncbi:hypothetical protein DM02DRAFT_676176 [Periconia macrospinosa]|uniref:Uncharacterized protein n=1 Tax=Periconia macrospinosa TaxID=97972 RepID=A0A2V1D8M0_9PLEO|nr:hypothetical protein DM02DRAFT_676176 [Periconia macrospinosa]
MSPTLNICPLLDPSFPDELLLSTIENLRFKSADANNNNNNNIYSVVALSQTHRHLASLVRTYERSITKSIVDRELWHAPRDFPCAEEKRGYAWLKYCIDGYDTIDAIMKRLTDPGNCVGVEKHNMASAYDGMLLLYQTSSLATVPEIHALLVTLPLSSLTSLYLATHHALLTARYHNAPSLVHQSTYGRQMDASTFSLRQDMSLAFCETCLLDGPEFIYKMLEDTPPCTREVALLNAFGEVVGREWGVDGEDVDERVGGNANANVPVVEGPARKEGGASVWMALVKRLEELFGVKGQGAVEECVFGR